MWIACVWTLRYMYMPNLQREFRMVIWTYSTLSYEVICLASLFTLGWLVQRSHNKPYALEIPLWCALQWTQMLSWCRPAAAINIRGRMRRTLQLYNIALCRSQLPCARVLLFQFELERLCFSLKINKSALAFLCWRTVVYLSYPRDLRLICIIFL